MSSSAAGRYVEAMRVVEKARFGPRLLRYFKDPSVPLWRKLSGFASALYVVWPLDLVPDVPVIGWLDDVGVVGLAVAWMVREVNRHAKSRTEDAPPR